MQTQPQDDPKALETFRRLGIAAMKIVYDAKVTPQILEILKGAEPPQAIAQATSLVLEQMKSKVSGVNPNTVYAVAPTVAVMVAELGHAAKLFQPSGALVQQALKIIAQKGDATPAAAPAAPATPAGLINSGAQ